MFKDKLKQLRMERNLKQSDVAKALGVTAATIGNYEQGTREPRNPEMWKKIADYFEVTVDYLMDKSIDSSPPNSQKSMELSQKRKEFLQYREDIPIIYNGVDITSILFSNNNEIDSITEKQWYAYVEFNSKSGHVLFARKKLLNILQKLKQDSKSTITTNLQEIIQSVEQNVVYWYNHCWNNIDSIFPKATSLETLYDLLNKCLSIDKIAEKEFSLIPLTDDFDWLREKLCY